MNIINRLRKEIKEREDKIKEIQNECIHPKSVLKIETGANTGNYDPGDDCYWKNYECSLCEKRWTEYSK